MPRSGFYNQNLYRDYPFQTQGSPLEWLHSLPSESSVSGESYATAALPHEAIVDFGCIMGLDANYVDRQDWIYLYRITRSDPFFIFEFRTTANSQVLLFVRRNDDPEYRYEWSEAQWKGTPYELPSLSSLSSASHPSSEGGWGRGCDSDDPVWEGFLVTGKFDELMDLIMDGEQLYFDSGYQVIEPARIQNLKESYVRSFNLANRARTHAIPADICLTSFSDGVSVGAESLAQDVKVYKGATCMQGPIAFEEGFNCQIRQEDTTGTIVIGAGVGLGAGEVCGEYPFYEGESIGEGESYYTGGPACTQILKTLNGKGGTRVRFDAGPGFNVRTAPNDPSTIIVEMTLEGFAICFGSIGGP